MTPQTAAPGSFARCLSFLAAAVCFALPSMAEGWDRADVLDAIHQVENPNNTLRVGRRGELGPFQFRPAVWHSYSQKPFALAADLDEAQAVAELHYDWIKRGLERNGLAVSPYQIGLVWNAGLTATLNGRTSANSRHYAQRVANLVEHKATATAATVAER